MGEEKDDWMLIEGAPASMRFRRRALILVFCLGPFLAPLIVISPPLLMSHLFHFLYDGDMGTQLSIGFLVLWIFSLLAFGVLAVFHFGDVVVDWFKGKDLKNEEV